MEPAAVAEIWRYPVMGLQGEKLERALVTREGISGDHLYAVVDARTKRVLDPKSFTYSWGTSEHHPSMLKVKAWLEDGRGKESTLGIEYKGETVSSDEAGFTRKLSAALSREVELVGYPRIVESRVKSGRTLHLLTDASLRAIARFHPMGDFDVRRFRPNVLAETAAEGFVEETWVGGRLKLGAVEVAVQKPNVRCKVTTMAQEGLEEDAQVLPTIESRNGKRLGVMCTVETEGTLAVGDPVLPKKE